MDKLISDASQEHGAAAEVIDVSLGRLVICLDSHESAVKVLLAEVLAIHVCA